MFRLTGSNQKDTSARPGTGGLIRISPQQLEGFVVFAYIGSFSGRVPEGSGALGDITWVYLESPMMFGT